MPLEMAAGCVWPESPPTHRVQPGLACPPEYYARRLRGESAGLVHIKHEVEQSSGSFGSGALTVAVVGRRLVPMSIGLDLAGIEITFPCV